MKAHRVWIGAWIAGAFLGGRAPAQERPATPAAPASPAGSRAGVPAPGETTSGPMVEFTLKNKLRVRGVPEFSPDDREGFVLRLEGGDTAIRFEWKDVDDKDLPFLQRRSGVAPEQPRPAETPAYRVRGLRIVLNATRAPLEGIEDAALSDDATLVIKTSAGRTRVPRVEIQSMTEADLPLTAVYTPKEVYDLLLLRHQPQDEKQWEALALDLMTQGLVQEARDVFRVLEILRHRELPVSKFYRDLLRLQEQLTTTAAKVAAFEVNRRVLDERYEEALGLLRQIDESNRDEALGAEIRRLRAAVEALRERRLEDRLVDEGYTLLRSLLTAKAADRSATFAESAAFADTALRVEILERLALQYHLDRPSVERIWDRRPHQRTFLARYGEGMWVHALPSSGNVEGWWRSAPNTSRFEYLEARAAEKFMRVVQTSEAKCSGCGGIGRVDVAVSTTPAGGVCPTCHGAKASRVVFYQ